jgi:predicted nucleotidyltransferase
MNDIAQLLKEKREEILLIAAKRGAHNIRVFGSVARGNAGLDSDIDFLIDLEAGRTLLDVGGLLMDLRKLLGCNVDIVTEKGLNDDFREEVLKEAIPL